MIEAITHKLMQPFKYYIVNTTSKETDNTLTNFQNLKSNSHHAFLPPLFMPFPEFPLAC